MWAQVIYGILGGIVGGTIGGSAVALFAGRQRPNVTPDEEAHGDGWR